MMMSLARISPDKLEVGTVLREGDPSRPVYYTVASVEPEIPRAFSMFGGAAPRPPKWRMTLRAATDEEKAMAEVMLT